MKKYIIVLLLFCNVMFSQNKTMIPTSGAIVFIKEEKIYDKDLYLKSFKELKPKMKKAMMDEIYIERLTDGKKTDTILLKSEVEKRIEAFEMMLPLIINGSKEEIKFYNEFNKDIITKYYTIDGELIKSKIIINKTRLEIKDEYDEYVEIEENDIIKLTEFRNETRVINGFNCFKVVYSYKASNKEFDFFTNAISNIREIWVTQDIKCNYHPVINEIEILKKYYPLEIVEYSEELKGQKTTYKLESYSLN
jgi:hypothetical protein